MRESIHSRANLGRLIIFLVVAGLHAAVLFVVINVDTTLMEAEPPATVMKLTDIEEEEPLPLPPPPPPPEQMDIPSNAVEAIAENMIETDEVPDQTLVSGIIIPQRNYGQEDYLPMHKISVAPVFSETEIKNRLVYPPIPLRAKIEGMVYLELFVDRNGQIRDITILKEDPPGRGFGEAAIKAFQGLQGTPAQANGASVAVRYRYPVRFAIRN
ncbi:hypothetical protein AGMMS4952_06900 [Spirochaetia bacterium]|nr:hypothetical protein AGMMS4952_06900 [Spirochaetia bacterium]